MSGYGIVLSKDDIERMDNDRFNYLKALINAEKLNPDDDYDSEREIALLTKIALSDLPYYMRNDLVTLLNDKTNQD